MSKLRNLLQGVKRGEISVDEALESLKKLPYENLDFAKIDNHRMLRRGVPETIYCQGKTPEQVAEIVKHMLKTKVNILGTRADEAVFSEVKKIAPEAVYYSKSRLFTIVQEKPKMNKGIIAIVSAGTSDIPVAEEAAVCAELFGNPVKRLYDVGVAGIHRLLMNLDILHSAQVIIVVAGMEGALASVVAGMVDKPVIAVPTSVGYGANFKGLSALLTMLNSCAGGITVVNIDNGYGAAFAAHQINCLGGKS